MDLRPEFIDLTQPNDLLALKKHLSEMADELDVLYTTTAPNGSISARQGRIALYNNGGTYSYWICTTGSTVWVEISNQTLWQVDGTETQLKTADEIDMQSKKIINVTDPTSAQDAATKAYADGKISKTTAAEISAMTEKTTLADADLFLIEDSAASNAKKKVQKSNVVTLPTSNVIFNWTGITESSGSSGFIESTSLTASFSSVVGYAYTGAYSQNAYADIFRSRWTKIAGVSTITIHALLWAADASHQATLLVDIGGQSNTVSTAGTGATPTWVTTSTIDVSSLINGTVYTIDIDLKNTSPGSNKNAYCGAVILIGS